MGGISTVVGFTEEQRRACEVFKKLVSKIQIVEYVVAKNRNEFLEIYTVIKGPSEDEDLIYKAEDMLKEQFKDILRIHPYVLYLLGGSLKGVISYNEGELIYSAK
jgi:hypothetical protein